MIGSFTINNSEIFLNGLVQCLIIAIFFIYIGIVCNIWVSFRKLFGSGYIVKYIIIHVINFHYNTK